MKTNIKLYIQVRRWGRGLLSKGGKPDCHGGKKSIKGCFLLAELLQRPEKRHAELKTKCSHGDVKMDIGLAFCEQTRRADLKTKCSREGKSEFFPGLLCTKMTGFDPTVRIDIFREEGGLRVIIFNYLTIHSGAPRGNILSKISLTSWTRDQP